MLNPFHPIVRALTSSLQVEIPAKLSPKGSPEKLTIALDMLAPFPETEHPNRLTKNQARTSVNDLARRYLFDIETAKTDKSKAVKSDPSKTIKPYTKISLRRIYLKNIATTAKQLSDALAVSGPTTHQYLVPDLARAMNYQNENWEISVKSFIDNLASLARSAEAEREALKGRGNSLFELERLHPSFRLAIGARSLFANCGKDLSTRENVKLEGFIIAVAKYATGSEKVLKPATARDYQDRARRYFEAQSHHVGLPLTAESEQEWLRVQAERPQHKSRPKGVKKLVNPKD